MRIATYYPTHLGRNDGSPLYYTHILRNMGHEVVHLSSEKTKDLDKFGKFDLHLWVDWGEDALKNILGFEPMSLQDLHPSVYVTSDTHLGYEYRLQKAKEFDYVLCNQKRAVEEFVRDGIDPKKVFWHPHAVEPLAYPNHPVAIRKYDIGFVGFVTFEKRAKMLDRILREFPNFWYGQRLFEEAARMYRKSRIVFNTAADDDVNMRVFETLATGSFLLTEYVPTLGELFADKKHLVWYHNMDEAVELAKYYLEHEYEREQIAKNGMKEVLAKHTYEHRAERILEIIK